jgi:hypothetical protein
MNTLGFIGRALLVSITAFITSTSIQAQPKGEPSPPKVISPPPPQAHPKVCWNVANGALALRRECLKPGSPFAPKGELALATGTSSIGARAYGFVFGSGELDKGRSSTNVASRRLKGTNNVYCVRVAGVNPNSAVPVASTDFSLSSCSSNPVMPISRLVNSGCDKDEFAFIFTICEDSDEAPEDIGNAFSFIVP